MKQREIKFRAKIKKSEYAKYKVGDWIYYSTKDIFENNFGHHLIEIENECQYAGLKDKNGKEVWKGDIVNVNIYLPTTQREEDKLMRKIWEKDGIKELKKRAEFYNGKWIVEDRWKLRSLEDKKRGNVMFNKNTIIGDLGKLAGVEIEVIGNIYENPKLLK